MISITRFTYTISNLVAGHYFLQYGVAFLADIGYAGRGVVIDECRRHCEWVDLEREAFEFEFVGDDL